MKKAGGNLTRVYTVADPLIAGHLESILAERGINALVRNRFLTGGVGELPPLEVWPEIWVDRDDADIAKTIIYEVIEPEGPPPPSWQCPDCGEQIEGQFAECWHCGASAP
jgi:hypothetical protein